MKLLKSNSNLFPSIFSDFFDADRFFGDFPGWDADTWLPAANIIENEKNYEIDLAIPGIRKEDIKMEIEGQLLAISAEKKEKKEEDKDSYVRREYRYNSFNRSFSLPDDANEDTIESRYENGILKITVPKKEAAAKGNKKAIAVQ